MDFYQVGSMREYGQNIRMALQGIVVLLCSGLLIALSATPHSYLIADVLWYIPGTNLFIHSTVVQWMLPLLMIFIYQRAVHPFSTSPVLFVVLSLATLLALVVVWLVSLARHDRWLSLLHCALVLWVLARVLRPTPRLTRAWILTLGAAVLAIFTYGAIWGETRCDENAHVGCIVPNGPRVWVPRLLATIGIPVFADLRGADLRGIDLSERDLRYADLTGADLRGANLSGANLRRAMADQVTATRSTWQEAYLDGASLTGANLMDADLRGVHAYRVDLRGADLRNANLREASLSHAYVAGAQLDGVNLQGAYLRFVEGLLESQLKKACGNEKTVLPEGFRIKFCWY